ncbi:VCBS repeat-containing protein, partial [Acinetobacter baumannii]
GAVVLDFFAFDPSLRAGVRVAAADLNGTGKANIIASLGSGPAAEVRVFDSTGKMISDFKPFGAFTGGASVAVGDVNGDGVPDI